MPLEAAPALEQVGPLRGFTAEAGDDTILEVLGEAEARQKRELRTTWLP